jgi:hypothetical protein
LARIGKVANATVTAAETRLGELPKDRAEQDEVDPLFDVS